MDDYSVIVNNSDIRSWSNFLDNTFPGRPLREISYLLDYSLFKLDPWGYHIQNILWHAINCWLVYLLAIRINLSKQVAILSAFFFLLHPIHVEVVANSSHRKDSLALAFLLMALLSYINIFEQKTNVSRIRWLVFTIILWITAFFAKGNTLIFPFIAIAYEYAMVPADKRLIIRWKQMVPMGCISFVVALVAWYCYISTLPTFKMAVIGGFVKTENLTSFSFYAYLLMILKSFAFMFLKMIFPVKLSMEYIYPVPKSLFDPWVIFTLIMIPLCCVVANRWRKTNPTMLFLLALSAILWIPTSNLFWQFSYFAADRYMYAPSVGLCILAVQYSEEKFSAVWRYAHYCWLVVFCLCTVLTWNQTKVWQTDISLYSNMLKVSPRSLEAMVGLANACYTLADYDKSASYAQQALERDRTDFRPYLILGNIEFAHGRLKEALQLFLEANNKNPLSPEVHNVLGSVYDEMGKTGEAIESFKTALALRQEYFEAYTNLGVTYERSNNLTEAEIMLKKALAVNSNYVPAWYNLGVVYYKKNDKQSARHAFSEVLKYDPYHKDALVNLCEICKETGDEACYNDTERRMKLITPNSKEISP